MDHLVNALIVDPADVEVARQLAQNWSLQELVSALGDSLTSGEGAVRSRATTVLGKVAVQGTSPRTNLPVVAKFFGDRLEDAESTVAAATALKELTSIPGFPVADSLKRLGSLEIRSLPVVSRLAILELLRSLVDFHDLSFVTVWTELTAGEKDPRNLMVSFDIAKRILDIYALSDAQAGEVYDVTFCYFPVTFKPPKDMPYKITTEDLRVGLRKVLVSPQLIKYVVPGLLEKIGSLAIATKLEALETLDAVIASNGQLDIWWKAVWDSLKMEILYGTPENDTFKPAVNHLKRYGELSSFIDELGHEMEQSMDSARALQLCHLAVSIESLVPAGVKAVLTLQTPPSQRVPLVNILLQAENMPDLDGLFQLLLEANDQEARAGLLQVAKKSSEHAPLVAQVLHDANSWDKLSELAAVRPDALRESVIPQLVMGLPSSLSELTQICVCRSLAQDLAVRLLASFTPSQPDAAEILGALVSVYSRLKKEDLRGLDKLVAPLLPQLSNDTPQLVLDRVSHLAELASRAASPNWPDLVAAQYAEVLNSLTPSPLFAVFSSSIAGLGKCPLCPSFVKLSEVVAKSRCVFERSGYLRFVAVAANKWPEIMDVQLFSQWLRKQIDTKMNSVNALELLAWLAKGLLARQDVQGYEIAHYITSLLYGEESGYAARVFGVLVAPDRLLVKENGCNVRSLYRQRLLLETLPSIEEYPSSSSLIALAALLRYTPSSAIPFERIFPLLLASLRLSIPLVQRAALECIVASSQLEVLVPYLSQIIPRFLALTKSQMVEVRAAAIDALSAVSQLEDAGRWRPIVLRGLVAALSDPKRDVRKRAVDCRQRFYSLTM